MKVFPDRIRHLKPVLFLYLLFQIFFFAPRLNSDGAYYFEYVRSLVLQNDLNFDDERTFFTWEWVPVLSHDPGGSWKDTGYPPNIFSFGPAMTWLPVYWVSHFMVQAANGFGGLNLANGYEMIYRLPVMCISLFAGWLALFLLDTLGKWAGYEEKIRGWTLFFLLGASHFPAFLFVTPAFSHALSALSSICFFMLWYRSRDAHWDSKGYALYGLSAAVMVVMRWQNAFSLVLPFCDALVAVITAPDRRMRMDRIKRWIVFGATFLFSLTPQLIVTKTLYGQAITDPQGKGGMHWLDPQWRLVLFDGLKGLFSVTPILFIGIVGIAFVIAAHRFRFAWGILFLFGIQLYINSVRRDWSGVGFGMRRFLNLLPAFSIGLMAFIDWFINFRYKKMRAGILLVTGFLLLVWNVLLMGQYYFSELGAPWTNIPVRQVWIAQFKEAPTHVLSLIRSGLAGKGITGQWGKLAVCFFSLVFMFVWSVLIGLKESIFIRIWKHKKGLLLTVGLGWVLCMDVWLAVSISNVQDYDVVKWTDEQHLPRLEHLRLNRKSGYQGGTDCFLCSVKGGYRFKKAHPVYIRDKFLALGRLTWHIRPIASSKDGLEIPLSSRNVFRGMVIISRWIGPELRPGTSVGVVRLSGKTVFGVPVHREFKVYADRGVPGLLRSDRCIRENLNRSFPAVNRFPSVTLSRLTWELKPPVKLSKVSFGIIESEGVWEISGIAFIRRDTRQIVSEKNRLRNSRNR